MLTKIIIDIHLWNTMYVEVIFGNLNIIVEQNEGSDTQELGVTL